MKITINSLIVITVLALGGILGASAISALAQTGNWTAPTVAPPGGNVPAPLNVGSILQERDGPLWFKSGLRVDGNLLIATSSPSVGKVLTALDSDGTVGWQTPTGNTGGAGSINGGCYQQWRTLPSGSQSLVNISWGAATAVDDTTCYCHVPGYNDQFIYGDEGSFSKATDASTMRTAKAWLCLKQ